MEERGVEEKGIRGGVNIKGKRTKDENQNHIALCAGNKVRGVK